MKISFHFENGTSKLIVIPENEREKSQINLFRTWAGEIKVSTPPGTPEGIMLSTDNYQDRAVEK
jgi:hypothetical protein